MHEETCLICILSQLWSADGSDWTVMRGWWDIRSFTNATIGKIMSLHCYTLLSDTLKMSEEVQKMAGGQIYKNLGDII